MDDLFLALRRSLASLARGKVWLYIVGPALVAVLAMVLMTVLLLHYVVAYDVLAAHASADEWLTLRRQHATPLLVLGALMAALAHAPFIGLLAPSLAALAYVHYGLEALRRLRQGAVVSVGRQ